MRGDMDNTKIICVGNTENLQRTNKLKGTAMEIMVKNSLGINHKDISIKKYVEDYLNKNLVYKIRVKKYFKIQNKLYSPDSFFYPKKHIKLDKYCVLYNLNYSRFHHPKYFFVDKKSLLSALQEHGLITKPKKIVYKRVDFVYKRNDVLYVMDCKNKENTGLTFYDMESVIAYIDYFLTEDVNIKNVAVVHNGGFSGLAEDTLKEYFSGKYPSLNINMVDCYDLLRSFGSYISRCNIFYDSSKKKYVYNLINGHDDKILIDIKSVKKRGM